MKPLLRFLYIIFYTIASILYLIVYFFEVILIFPIAFFYYIFTGKNYFHQNYDDMFFVKMNHKFEKIMNNMDPDYKEPNEIDNIKTNYIIDSDYKNYNNLNKYIVHYNKGLKYYHCIAHDIDEAIAITKKKFGNDIEIKWVELLDNVEKINALINLEKENYNTLYEYDVYYMHDNQSYVFRVAALDDGDARDKALRTLHEDILIYDVVKV